MSRESLYIHSGIWLNVVLLYLQLGEFPFISSVLHSPHWDCPSINVTRKQMDVHGSKSPGGSEGSKVVVKLSQSADGRGKISQAAQRPSSRVQALMNKSCSPLSNLALGPGQHLSFT